MEAQGSLKSGHTVLVFEHRREAEEAVRRLSTEGIRPERISFFVQATPEQGISKEGLNSAIERGGRLGAGLGAIAGFGLFAIPGLGLVLGTGSLTAGLAGAILGGSLGGTAGSLIGAGLSEADAAVAEHHLREGKSVVIISTMTAGPDSLRLPARESRSKPSRLSPVSTR